MDEPSVLGFLFDSDLRFVVLVEKESPIWQEGLYNVPGGRLEIDEQPMFGIEREFHAATGLILNTWMTFGKIRKPAEQTIHLYTTSLAAGRIEGSLRGVQAVLWVVDREETVQGARLPASRLVPDLPWLTRLARSFHQGDRRYRELIIRGYTTE